MFSPSPKIRIGIYAAFFVTALVALILQMREAGKDNQAPLPRLGAVPTFSLTADDSTAFTTNEIRGHVIIADFIFTNCGGPCPLMSAQMQELQREFQKESDIRLLSFSVDPDNDTPGVLRTYGQRFGALSGKWTFLTGLKSTIYNLTRNGFHLALDEDQDAIAHSTKFVLIDKETSIRGYYDSDDRGSMKRLVEDARSLH